MSTSEELPNGAVDPLVDDAVTGWASAGGSVSLSIDAGEPAVTAVAHLPRRFLFAPRLDDQCGFALVLPAAAQDSRSHVLHVRDAEGNELPGSPRRYRSRPRSGSVDSVIDNVIRGHIVADELDDDAPIAVSAVVGQEIVAVAAAVLDPAHEGKSRRAFTLIIPHSVAAAGHRFVQIIPAGTPSALPGSPAVLPRAPRVAAQVVSRSLPVTIGIKVAAPNLKIAHEWGDYHYGKQLAAALQRRGWVARVDCADEWQTQGDDVNLVLRGRHRCLVDAGAVNLMWQISHPDRLAGAETRDFDHLFVASDIHSRALSNQTSTPVSTLHQATDPAVFRPTVKKLNLAQSALFVGNSRKEYRTIVRWCVEQGIDLAVFGSRWTDVIPDHYVLGTHILNEDLHRWYGSCEILLNDHWDTMREEGFLSNRLFDGSAAGAFIITDPVRGLAEVFGDAIETAADPRELKDKVTYYLAHPEERAARAERARAIVMANHTFDHRADDIIAVYEVIARRRGLGRFFTDEAQLV